MDPLVRFSFAIASLIFIILCILTISSNEYWGGVFFLAGAGLGFVAILDFFFGKHRL